MSVCQIHENWLLPISLLPSRTSLRLVRSCGLRREFITLSFPRSSRAGDSVVRVLDEPCMRALYLEGKCYAMLVTVP